MTKKRVSEDDIRKYRVKVSSSYSRRHRLKICYHKNYTKCYKVSGFATISGSRFTHL